MKITLKKASILLIAMAMLMTGCAGVGPVIIGRDRLNYTAALSESWKSEMLLNMVKLRYGDTPVFLDVVSVINSYEVSGAASLGGTWKFNPSYESGASAGTSGFYADRPTITYAPLRGERFSRSMLTPIPPSSIFYFIQSGYNAAAVFRVLVQSINGIRNNRSQITRSLPADPDFYRLTERLVRVQASGAYEIRIRKNSGQEALAAVFSQKVDEKTQKDIREIRDMLGLDHSATEFKVVYGAFASGNTEIAILSRSVLQVIIGLASYIEVPEAHIAEKRALPGPVAEEVDGTRVPPLIRIRSSSVRPVDAFVAIPYRDHWFWIDDKDVQSKGLFSFLEFVLNLVDTGIKEGMPVVTIPTR